MPGLEITGKVPAIEPPEVVALTLPSSPLEVDEARLELKAPERSPEDTSKLQHGCHWPLSMMRREKFKKGEYLFKIGDRAEKLFYIGKGNIRFPEINRSLSAGQVF